MEMQSPKHPLHPHREHDRIYAMERCEVCSCQNLCIRVKKCSCILASALGSRVQMIQLWVVIFACGSPRPYQPCVSVTEQCSCGLRTGAPEHRTPLGANLSMQRAHVLWFLYRCCMQHVHAPALSRCGICLTVPLLQWLGLTTHSWLCTCASHSS